MKLTNHELEFLSVWAREEWEPACYTLPAHQLQLAHKISGASLIAIIKSWTQSEGKKDVEILHAASASVPTWPWPSAAEFQRRLDDANLQCSRG